VFEMAHNIALNKNGTKLARMLYLKYSILKNEVDPLLVSTNTF
jgi:hypothetical protein